MKICIDAGHYGKYNQSPADKRYYESEFTWKLHLLQKKYLEEYGVEVVTTRPGQAQDRGLYSRGTASEGCALFLSDHTNAVGAEKCTAFLEQYLTEHYVFEDKRQDGRYESWNEAYTLWQEDMEIARETIRERIANEDYAVIEEE